MRVFNGKTGAEVMNFMAFDPDFRGGVSIAAADLNRDGKSELIVGAGPGGGPHVRSFDFVTGQQLPGPLGSFFAYEPDFRGGVHVGTDWKTGDFTGDGWADLVVGPGAGHAPDVKVYSGATGNQVRTIHAFDNSMNAGVRVGLAYVTDDTLADVVVATGVGVTNEVRVFDTYTKQQLTGGLGTYTPFGPVNMNGVTLATSNDPPGGGSPPPPAAPTYYDLDMIHKQFDFLHSENGPNKWNSVHIDESAIVQTNTNRLRWILTITNTGTNSPMNHDLFDVGMGYFRLDTAITSDITFIPNSDDHGWTSYGHVVPNGSVAGGSIEWTPNSTLAHGDTLTLWFETPICTPMTGGGDAAQFGGDDENGITAAESHCTDQLAIPGDKIEITITRVVNNVSEEADELKVAKWNDAFIYRTYTDANPELLVRGPNSQNSGNPNLDFIDRDKDRFNVWVHDMRKWSAVSSNGLPTNKYITVDIDTTNRPFFTDYNDHSKVSLVRYTGGAINKQSGWYWSDSQMLVSNTIDDIYSDLQYLQVDGAAPIEPVTAWGDPDLSKLGLPKSGGYQWKVSDRTHKIALGGFTDAIYQVTPTFAIEKKVETKIKRVMNLNVNILRGTVDGKAVTDYAQVEQDIKLARETFAQVGIDILPADISIVNPPAGVNLQDDGLRKSIAIDPVTLKSKMDQEDAALLGFANYRTARMDVEVYYVNYSRPLSAGTSYTQTLMPDNKFANSVVISEHDSRMPVLAHEICHVIENINPYTQNLRYHYPYDLNVAQGFQYGNFLMVDGEFALIEGKVTDSKRLIELEEFWLQFDPQFIVRFF